jgi:uncharacterized protein
MTAGTSRAIIVFARAPHAGLVKTRLIPALGAHGAAALYRVLLDHTLQQVESCPDITPYLFADTAAAGQWFEARLSARWRCAGQTGDNLGARMHAALAAILAVHSRVILLGSDIVDCSADKLVAALEALDNFDVVIGPAADGGYWLLGLKRPNRALFEAIEWGSEVVLAQTIHRLNDAGLRWTQASLGHDIDTPHDLARHAQALCSLLPESLLGARELRAKLLDAAALQRI